MYENADESLLIWEKRTTMNLVCEKALNAFKFLDIENGN